MGRNDGKGRGQLDGYIGVDGVGLGDEVQSYRQAEKRRGVGTLVGWYGEKAVGIDVEGTVYMDTIRVETRAGKAMLKRESVL